MAQQLFEGKLIRFTAFDPDRDAEPFARWTHDPEYLHANLFDAPQPLAAFHVKKKFEEMEKEAGRDFYFFVIRTAADDRTVGFARFHWIEWNHGNAHLTLIIGLADDRGKGYGGEAMDLLLRYAFEELNLFRVTIDTTSDNPGAQRFLEKHCFQLEVRRREAVYHSGQYFDQVTYGILAEEWQRNFNTAGVEHGS